MTIYDVGKLSRGDVVIINGRLGIVADTHEPQWRDHKRKQWQHTLNGADIQFPGESSCIYHRIADIHKPEIEE